PSPRKRASHGSVTTPTPGRSHRSSGSRLRPTTGGSSTSAGSRQPSTERGNRASTTARSRTGSPTSLRTARRSARRRRRLSRRRRRPSSRANSTSSAGRCTTRPASWWCPRVRRSRSSRTCTRCNGSRRASSGRSRQSSLRASRVGGLPGSAREGSGACSSGAARLPAVRMVGISKRFPGVVANDDVSFEAAAGEVHALLGENGAGKTTLSNILTGLYRQDEGTIELYGEQARFHSPRHAPAGGIWMFHQPFRLVEPFSVAENVVLGDHRRDGRRLVVHSGAIEK